MSSCCVSSQILGKHGESGTMVIGIILLILWRRVLVFSSCGYGSRRVLEVGAFRVFDHIAICNSEK